MEWITTHWQEILAWIGGIVTAASIIVRLTKTERDDKALNAIMKILVALSLFNPDGSLIGYKDENKEK